MFDITELERYANHRGYPEELPSFGPVASSALSEIRKLRAALKLGRECVMESFDYVKTTDDQMLADARLRDIDQALALAE